MSIVNDKYEFIDICLQKLSKSKFRSSFKLKDKDIQYIYEKGFNVIEEHAYKFVRERLAPAKIDNDGRQTPMKGHPVFVAQHATACCCRECLYKWHHISKNRSLTENEINFVVALIMKWIVNEYKKSSKYIIRELE